jgi:hypothetical protein
LSLVEPTRGADCREHKVVPDCVYAEGAVSPSHQIASVGLELMRWRRTNSQKSGGCAMQVKRVELITRMVVVVSALEDRGGRSLLLCLGQ